MHNPPARPRASGTERPTSNRWAVLAFQGVRNSVAGPRGAPTVCLMSHTTRTETASRGSAPDAGVVTPGSTESQQYRDRNVEIHARWREANEKLARARKRRDKLAIAKAENAVDAVAAEFYQANRGLAVSAARPFITAGDQHGDDYVSAAALGLWEAFKKWDPTKGVTFGTFSRQYIKGRLVRSVRASEYGHISQTDFNRRKEVRDTLAKLSLEFGREATHDEIAAVLSCPVDAVRRALAPAAASLDVPLGDGERTLADTISDRLVDDSNPLGVLADELDQITLDRMLDELNELELWLVCTRGELLGTYPQSLAEIADEIGVGREITRRAEAKAKARLVHTKLCIDLGRLPTDAELAAAIGVTPEKAVAMVRSTWGDLHSRWKRAAAALRDARVAHDLPAADRRRARLDRIGEEVMTLGAELGAEASVTYRENGEPIGPEIAMSDLWDAFRAWNPITDPQFAAWVRRWWASHHSRIPLAQQSERPTDVAAAAPTLWSRIRRSGRDLPVSVKA